jgi:hypothetical protein
VKRLNATYDHLKWMNLHELSRYWAARELTAIRRDGAALELDAPFACDEFTVRVSNAAAGDAVALVARGETAPLARVDRTSQLQSGRYAREGRNLVASFALPRGRSRLTFGPG